MNEFERLLIAELRKVRDVLQRLDDGIRKISDALTPRDEDIN